MWADDVLVPEEAVDHLLAQGIIGRKGDPGVKWPTAR